MNRGQLCPGQDARTRDRTGGSRGEQMQEAARSEPDGGLLDREARQLLHQPLPATSRLGRRHGKRPFSTTGDKRSKLPSRSTASAARAATLLPFSFFLHLSN